MTKIALSPCCNINRIIQNNYIYCLYSANVSKLHGIQICNLTSKLLYAYNINVFFTLLPAFWYTYTEKNVNGILAKLEKNKIKSSPYLNKNYNLIIMIHWLLIFNYIIINYYINRQQKGYDN